MRIETNADETVRQFKQAGIDVDRAARKAVRRTAYALQARIRKNASTGYHKRKRKVKFRGHIPGTGPGPNVNTGNYRRSVQVTHDGLESIVGTNAPQARRLEYGFRGTDSRGRAYDQRPYPHWEPANKIVQPTLQSEIAKALMEALYGKPGKRTDSDSGT